MYAAWIATRYVMPTPEHIVSNLDYCVNAKLSTGGRGGS